MTLALPVGAVMNCADNSGAKNLYVSRGRATRLPAIQHWQAPRRKRDMRRRMARLLRPFLRRLTSRPRALHVTRATPLILLYTLQIIAVTRFGARLNRLPAASAGDMVMATGKRHRLACSSTELTLLPCSQSRRESRISGRRVRPDGGCQ